MAQGITFTGRNQAGGAFNLSRALMAAAMPRIERAAELTIKDAQDGIISNIHATYGQRQGAARSEPLADVARYPGEIETRPTGVTIRFRVEGSPAFLAKWGALNYGAAAHTIAPRNQRGVLANRTTGFFARGPVTWSSSTGKFGTRFWNRAIEDALQFFRHRL